MVGPLEPRVRASGALRSVSIVLPAFNEGENITAAVRAVLDALDGRGWEGEVIVVDDGSHDDTRARVEAVAEEDPRVRLVPHGQNQGYGAALRSGIGAARCEHIFFTDADLQFDVGEIGRLEAWSASYDIIVGYRRPRQDHWVRRFNGWSWNRLINGLFGLGVRDVDCAFKVFHRRVFESIGIQSLGAFVNSEILVRASAAGFRIKEVPVSHYPRRAGMATGGQVRVIGRAWMELGGLYRELRTVQRAPRRRRPAGDGVSRPS
jgi:glycosyltransferase involved in cell wall biosynthesis